MSSASQIVDRARGDVHRIMAGWFTDLLELRRLGVLAHTWTTCQFDEDSSASTEDSMLEGPEGEELRQAA